MELKNFTGWIRADGSLLPCTYEHHLEVARSEGETNPDLAGWIHVCFGEAIETADCTPSARQVETLVRVCLANNATLPAWLGAGL